MITNNMKVRHLYTKHIATVKYIDNIALLNKKGYFPAPAFFIVRGKVIIERINEKTFLNNWKIV